MYEYQDTGIEWLGRREHALLADEPGLGKTRQLLLAAEGRTLAVAPAMLEGVWRAEYNRWQPDIDLTIAAYSGICKRAPNERGEMRKVLPTPIDELAGFDTVIFDEAHYLKGRDTMWSKAARKIAAERVWFATGTPIPNWAHELWVLLHMMHPKDKRFSSYWRWCRYWFKVWTMPGRGTRVGALRDDRTWQDFQEQNLRGLFLRRMRDDVLTDLPPLTEQTIECPMKPAQKRFYDDTKKNFMANIDGVGDVVSWSAGSQNAHLLAASTGLEIVHEDAPASSGKLDMVRELLRDWEGAPCILACHRRRTAAVLGEICRLLKRKAVVVTGETPAAKRFDAVEAWQNGSGDVLVATIESLKEGLTITRADRMVFVERSYRPSWNEGVMRRVHRIGQTRPVLVVQLVTVPGVDVGMRSLLGRKTDQQMRALPTKDFAELL